MITIPPQLIEAVILRPNEQTLWLWRFDSLQEEQHIKGFTIITNCRLIFLEETGIFTKKYSIHDSIDHENIRGISITGWIFKSLQIDRIKDGVFSKLSMEFREVDKNSLTILEKINIEEVRVFLNRLIRQRLESMEEEKRRSKIQYVMDFSFLKAEMEKGGITLTAIKCPSCGANVNLPRGGSSFVCNYCKNAIHAHDVFQKMKGLIQSL